MEIPPDAAQGYDRLYGLELTELTREHVRGQVVVREELKQPYGLVHGGVYAAFFRIFDSGTGPLLDRVVSRVFRWGRVIGSATGRRACVR